MALSSRICLNKNISYINNNVYIWTFYHPHSVNSPESIDEAVWSSHGVYTSTVLGQYLEPLNPTDNKTDWLPLMSKLLPFSSNLVKDILLYSYATPNPGSQVMYSTKKTEPVILALKHNSHSISSYHFLICQQKLFLYINAHNIYKKKSHHIYIMFIN